MTREQKWKRIKQALSVLEKQFGKGAVMRLLDEPDDRIETIAAGCPSLVEAMGCGGYPRGRVVEIFGPESSGKTTLTLHAIAACQRQGGVAAFVDAEHALDVGYAARLGVDARGLLVSQPDTGEQALEIAETLARCGGIDLVVVDSVAALVPRAEIEGQMGDAHVGLQARLMSQALRKLTPVVHREGVTMMFINQLRQKIGVSFGSSETTTGGNALKFYASMRLDVRRVGPLKSGDEVCGNRTRVKVVKNKLAPPFKTAEFDIRFGTGIDLLGDLLDRAVQAGLVTRSGSFFHLDGVNLGQGREQARAHLACHPEICDRLASAQGLQAGGWDWSLGAVPSPEAERAGGRVGAPALACAGL